MELDKKERLFLINQFLILEKLYPEESNYYAIHRKALTEGYELHYKWMYENLWDELTEDECRKVLDILDMYRALHFTAEKSEDENLKGHYWLKFKGFDGNNESSYMAYCRYFIVDLGRFDELRYGHEIPDFNSHMQLLPKYSAMLNVWKHLGKPADMSDGQAIEILEANPHA